MPVVYVSDKFCVTTDDRVHKDLKHCLECEIVLLEHPAPHVGYCPVCKKLYLLTE